MLDTRRIQDFILKGKEIFVGLEDSKRTWKLAVRHDRRVVHQVSMEARIPVLLSYLTNRFPDCTIHLIYEAGFKGFNLYDRLIEEGMDCVVIPPHLVTEEKVSKVKTDRRDANRLAFILESGDLRSLCDVPDRERREDRQISRTLTAIGKDIIRTRNRIHKFIDFHGIDLPFASKGKWGRREFACLGTMPLPKPLRESLDIYLTLLAQLWEHQAALRESLRQLCKKERYRRAFLIARSLPGIGWYTAIRFVLELGEDLSRFTSAKKIAGFVGLTPGERSTGETERKGRITGMGPGFIRSTLIENSWTAVRVDHALLNKFLRVKKNTGSKKKAIIAIARILIIRLRACLIAGEPYRMGVVG